MKKSIAAMTAITAITAAVCASQSGIVAAQQRVADANYPSKPIRLIVPQAPGGSNDIMARFVGGQLAERLQKQVVVDNRPGAEGIIGSELVARAAPDGYTLLMASTAFTMNPAVVKKLPYDPIKDFDFAALLGRGPVMIVAGPSLAVNSLKELIAVGKSKPNFITIASAGGFNHFVSAMFRSHAGFEATIALYKGGGPAVAAVLAGEAQLVFGSVTASMPLVRAAKLRALAVTGLARSSLAPELPTLHESGFPGFNVTAWQSIVAPAGTPRGIVMRMHGEIIKALATPEVTRLFHNIGYEITGTTPEKLAEIILEESRLWARVIREAGIRPE